MQWKTVHLKTVLKSLDAWYRLQTHWKTVVNLWCRSWNCSMAFCSRHWTVRTNGWLMRLTPIMFGKCSKSWTDCQFWVSSRVNTAWQNSEQFCEIFHIKITNLRMVMTTGSTSKENEMTFSAFPYIDSVSRSKPISAPFLTIPRQNNMSSLARLG